MNYWNILDPFHLIVPVRPGEATQAYKVGFQVGSFFKNRLSGGVQTPTATAARVTPKRAVAKSDAPAVNGVSRKSSGGGILLLALAVGAFLLLRKK